MKYILVVISCSLLLSCSSKEKRVTVTLKNSLEIRRMEMISVPFEKVKELFSVDSTMHIYVEDQKSKTHAAAQWVDADGNGTPEEFIFPAQFDQQEEKRFDLILSPEVQDTTLIANRTYAKFVPERIDDIAWENDLVAFRTYGPEAQRLVDEKLPGGTLSSGIDCWLKRVQYPVIDKWYKKYTSGGTYHKDDGEGYDPYHVGASRGCGGIGVLSGDSLFVSKNFVSYKILANGPLRTIFELTYAPWNANGAEVTERKIISIDDGSQLCNVHVQLQSAQVLPDVTIGITLHDKKGAVSADSVTGWFRYWEPMDDSEIGTGVVIDPKVVTRYRDFRTEKKDLSHIYVTAKLSSGALIYYTGFAWKKAGAITNPRAWDNYLAEFSARIASPIDVIVGH